MLIDNYTIDDNSIENLKALHFYHMGEGVYAKRFPVYYYGKIPTLYGVFVANNEDKNINIDVFDENGNLYAPYYSSYNNNEVIRTININLKREMKKCNIEGENK